MSDGSPQDWLDQARGDLRLASLGRADGAVPLDLACSHAQQAVEKALKALLVQAQVDFPRTHDLEELLALLPAARGSLPTQLAEVTTLIPYAVQTRYPGFEEPVTTQQTDAALRLAEQFLQWAQQAFNQTPS